MKVEIGKYGIEQSWQADFPKRTECHKCGGEARIAFVAHELDEDDESCDVCNLHKNGGKGDYWPHDSIAVAVYFCRDCFEANVIWNQA